MHLEWPESIYVWLQIINWVCYKLTGDFTMVNATGLISSPFDIAKAKDIPF